MDAAELVSRLRAAGCVFAEGEARLLRAATTDPDRLADLVRRRVAGEPLEYILGWVAFRGRRISVSPGVFVPRQRTAYLAGRAVARARPGATVLDLCCGCGALGAALLAEVPGSRVYAADIDPVAVACARGNLPRVYLGDLYDPLPADLRGRIDLLVANAPYVPTGALGAMPPEARDHEPPVALDGGADGLDILRRVVAGAPDWLAPGGYLLVESGRDQAPALAAAMSSAGLGPSIESDDDAYATVVIGAAG